jgi:hypothetical protein
MSTMIRHHSLHILGVALVALTALTTTADAAPKAGKRARIQSPSLEALCDMAAERQRDLSDIDADRADTCSGSITSPGALQCDQSFERAKERVINRYEARMDRFRNKAVKELGRKLKGDDCCIALPTRFQAYGEHCIATR